MTTLIVGASGATGKQLVEQLISLEQELKLIVRSLEKLPESWKNNDRVTIIPAELLEFGVDELAEHARDCHAVASCLGHNSSLKGIFGEPRKLVTDSVSIICNA